MKKNFKNKTIKMICLYEKGKFLGEEALNLNHLPIITSSNTSWYKKGKENNECLAL